MHPVVIDKPYRFVPPYRGRVLSRMVQALARWQLRRSDGVESVECSGLERLRASTDAGHGIILAPNHCRPSDPMVVNEMCRQAGVMPYTMASWHLFMSSRLQALVLRWAGGFSVYREGMDRQALQAAIEILVEAERPLVMFPEGVITRTNDRLYEMMEGLSFIARSAAKKRAASEKKVVVHPVAIRYHYHGDVETSLNAALDDIENRLSWRPKRDEQLADRIVRVGQALLWLKEIEYCGGPKNGDLGTRLEELIDRILTPLEDEWLDRKSDEKLSVVARVKLLRSAILPDMIEAKLDSKERQRRWDQLGDMYLAQQIGHYPPDYIRSNPTTERMLETVEKFEEDLTDQCRCYRPITVKVEVGEPIKVPHKRVRGSDPVMSALESQLHQMLDIPYKRSDDSTAKSAGLAARPDVTKTDNAESHDSPSEGSGSADEAGKQDSTVER